MSCTRSDRSRSIRSSRRRGSESLVALGHGALANPDMPQWLAATLAPRAFDSGILGPIADIKERELAFFAAIEREVLRGGGPCSYWDRRHVDPYVFSIGLIHIQGGHHG